MSVKNREQVKFFFIYCGDESVKSEFWHSHLAMEMNIEYQTIEGGNNMKYNNPIISGYNPDPSICRVGEDYYLVNSSFEYFPGVPIYHSRNLANWELTGHCLSEKAQLDLEGCRSSGGIYAPTLRYHEGTFFMTTTNVSGKGNFIVHTRDIGGKWSEPVWIDQGGIDPSLLFDEDGRVYFASAASDSAGRAAILMCEINPFTGEKRTESRVISYGCGGRYPEGPHLYKWFGKYYLMLAEGGTEYGHMETLLRSDNPYGPFEECPHNPILTHRDDMRGEIHATGHADILEDHNGNWWLVCLGIRTCQKRSSSVMLHNLGRETFLTPVSWGADGWLEVGEKGRISLEMEGKLPGTPEPVSRDFQDNYSVIQGSPHYNFLRNPSAENYYRDTDRKRLVLKGTKVTLNEVASPTWIGVRQKDFDVRATVKAELLQAETGVRAGLTAFYNEAYHYEIYLTREGEKNKVCLAKHVHDIFTVTAFSELPEGTPVFLRIEADDTWYCFLYSLDGVEFSELGRGLTVGLCTEGTKTMTFTGTYIGLFAENGEAAFQNFEVEVLS